MKLTQREKVLAGLIALLALAAAGVFQSVPHIAQPAGYHQFADARGWLDLPNAQNVLSNLPFLFAGLAGLGLLAAGRLLTPNRAFAANAALFFLGLIATAGVSAWYHAAPENQSLVFDRLGMTLAFAGILGMLAADKVSERAGWTVGLTTLAAGPGSVLWWQATGNLAPYAVVQFGGMLLLLLAALLWRNSGGPAWGWVLGLYAVAKLFELYDFEVYAWSGHFISGHALKHLVAAATALAVIVPLMPKIVTRNRAARLRALG